MISVCFAFGLFSSVVVQYTDVRQHVFLARRFYCVKSAFQRRMAFFFVSSRRVCTVASQPIRKSPIVVSCRVT